MCMCYMCVADTYSHAASCPLLFSPLMSVCLSLSVSPSLSLSLPLSPSLILLSLPLSPSLPLSVSVSVSGSGSIHASVSTHPTLAGSNLCNAATGGEMGGANCSRQSYECVWQSHANALLNVSAAALVTSSSSLQCTTPPWPYAGRGKETYCGGKEA